MLNYFVKKINNKKGFTLVELVVVIAILGILAALAVPKLSSSSQNAERAAVEANLRTIDGAISMFIAQGNELSATPTIKDLVGVTLQSEPVGPKDVEYEISEVTIGEGDNAVKEIRAIVNSGGAGGIDDLSDKFLPITWE